MHFNLGAGFYFGNDRGSVIDMNKKIKNLLVSLKKLEWFKNKKITEKLLIVFLLIAIFSSLSIGTMSVVSIIKINNLSAAEYTQNIVPLTPLNKIEKDVNSICLLIRDIGLDQSNSFDDAAGIPSLTTDLYAQIKSYSAHVSADPSDMERKNLNVLTSSISDIVTNDAELIGDYKTGKIQDGNKILYGTLSKPISNYQSAIDNAFKINTAMAGDRNESNNRSFYLFLTLLAAIILLTLGISVAGGLYMARIIGRPIKKLAEVADSISEGNLDVDIDISAKDEIGILAQAFKKIISSLQLLKTDVDKLIHGALDGKLDTRAETENHSGAYRGIIDGVNKSLDAITGPLYMAADYVDKISKGDIPEKITDDYKGDFNLLKDNLNICIDAINSMISDANMLSSAAVQGNLSARADAARHQGDYRRIIEGVNHTLDAITAPLNMAADYVDRISRGSIPEPVTDEYHGDFNKIKVNLNTCIGAINGLIVDANMLSSAAVAGDLSARADTQRHQGDFRRIIEGVNSTLDAITGPLNVAADYVDRISRGDMPEKITDDFSGDFNIIKNNLNTCIDAVNGLIADANMLAEAAEEGRLSVRAGAEKHQGDFRRIIEGVNNTLDAFIGPVEESAAVLNEMAKGNLTVMVEGDYRGDFAQIKVALNDTITSLSGYIGEISQTLAEISDGNLNVEITSDFRGDFVEIKNSINHIILSLNETIREIICASDEVAAGSSQVSSGSQQLSQGAAEQASAIEQLTASISQIAAQTRQNAINAGRANEITAGVKNDAIKGNEQMKQMLEAMKEIGASSASVKKIIKVIDEIAFQTNILSLNAAVEAARAGQAGKGFAVVADEVRNLAARSAKAANETTELIENSIDKSELGMKISRGTAEALDKIVTGTEKAAALVGDISVASNEQATGIAQIKSGVQQISMVVQSNSATAEESAASSEELSGQSEMLKEKVGRFSLKTEL